mmetsp:Transcript_11270/g.26723  ORF Transcript_11270/g.26723 Transcript_11270/m.26723 type:complete len:421 (-) Transcript_11270:32-1294(-)
MLRRGIRAGRREEVGLAALAGDNLGEVHHALRVAPLVVVPGHDLDHVVTHDHREGSVDGGGDVGAAEVDADEGLLLNREDALEGALRGLLEGIVHLLGEGLLLGLDDEVHDRDVGGRHAEGNAVKLALELGENESDSLGSASGGGHDGEGSSAGAAEIAVGGIQQALVTSIGVGGGHGALHNAELLVEDLNERREAVGGAGRVGDNVLGLRVVVLCIHTDNICGDIALARSSDDNLLGTSLEMLPSTLSGEEDTGSLNHKVDPKLGPWQLGRVPVGDDGDDLAINADVAVVNNLDIGTEHSKGGVVLEQVRGLLDATRVVDGNNVKQSLLAAVPAAQEVAPNATKTVDRDLHGGLSNNGLSARSTGSRSAASEHRSISKSGLGGNALLASNETRRVNHRGSCGCHFETQKPFYRERYHCC